MDRTNKMDRTTFLELLEKHGKGKFVSTKYVGQIRYFDEDGASYCPITYLCFILTSEHFMPTQYPSAAELLGIDHELMNVIVDAADKAGDRILRPLMIKTLDIKQQ